MTEKEIQDRQEREREKRREYYRKNKDKIAVIQKRYRENHRQQIRDYQRAYRQSNPGMVEQWRKNAVVAAYLKIKEEEKDEA